MNQNVYEALFILDSNVFARDRAAIPAQVEEIVKKAGGEILVSRLWEERRLAYAIKGHRKGTYWLIYFKIDSQKLTEITHQLGITDNVLRHMVLKIHPKLVEAIIAHAQGRPLPEEPKYVEPSAELLDEIEIPTVNVEELAAE